MGVVASTLSAALAPFGYQVIKRQAAASRNCPSVLLVTLPKSGSIFLYRTLAASLKLQHLDVSPGYFPEDNLDLRSILEFAKGGYIAQAHVNASPFNMSLLARFCDKWVVHLRDPRAALLSWTHHKDRPKIYDDPQMALRNYPLEPDEYYSSMNFGEKVDWQIDNYLPQLIRWIEAWCDVIDSSEQPENIVVTKYEELAGHDEEFIRELIDRLGLPVCETLNLAAKDMSNHFRNGSPDEWRSALTPAQIRKMTEIIPPQLFKRFEWDAA